MTQNKEKRKKERLRKQKQKEIIYRRQWKWVQKKMNTERRKHEKEWMKIPGLMNGE